MSSVWDEIRRQEELSEQMLLQAAEAEEEAVVISGDEQGYDYDCEYDEYIVDTDEEDYESQLLSAQQQWEESLEQLSQVFNWILLPLVGKYLGRRTALRVWKNVMQYIW
ncbi:LAQU0S25e00474g1_1 [Lachancea quebecensis]|uniref:LAQU0S25e00474g1_1 n=1 Tax=Lachancea quebecensis TaxID=1654605 RepID=A0A0P1KYL7_9SACH|nr:LAQU0S25e00474g1_1 [Lachancea quebecensis]